MRILLYSIILLIGTSCSFSESCHTQGLDEAQSMLNCDPVKAFEQLNKYDVSEFNDSASMARWALLYSEAMVANHLSAPTDTIINIAINYYGSHNKMMEFNKALQVKADLTTDSNAVNLHTSALYIQKEKEFMLYKEKAYRHQIVCIAIIVILITVTIIIWQCQKIKLKDAQHESLMAEALSLKEGLTLQQSQCSTLNEKLSASLATRFNIIDELCSTYYESQGTKIEKKAIVDKVKSHIEALKSDEGIFSEMEQCHEDLLCLFRKEIPDLKPEEYRLMVYLTSGLSNRTIALLIGENINVAYKRKSRLKAKISESDASDKDLFLSKF